MNGEKTAAVKKIYNTNEHVTPSEAASQLWFWCFRKRNLQKADSFKKVICLKMYTKVELVFMKTAVFYDLKRPKRR